MVLGSKRGYDVLKKESTVDSLNQMAVPRHRLNLNADIHRSVYFV